MMKLKQPSEAQTDPGMHARVNLLINGSPQASARGCIALRPYCVASQNARVKETPPSAFRWLENKMSPSSAGRLFGPPLYLREQEVPFWLRTPPPKDFAADETCGPRRGGGLDRLPKRGSGLAVLGGGTPALSKATRGRPQLRRSPTRAQGPQLIPTSLQCRLRLRRAVATQPDYH